MNNRAVQLALTTESLLMSKCWNTDFFFPKFTFELSAENKLKLP
jgi:hypothetical protein